MLEVKELKVDLRSGGRDYPVLEEISFRLRDGEILGLVGESGCGKSVTASAVMGLLKQNLRIRSGQILYNGQDISRYTAREYEPLRGKELSMILQDSLSSLNPLMRVGKQLEEAYSIHYDLNETELKARCLEALQSVNLGDDAELIMRKYPHQLSGGQRQRILIAMAVAAKPRLLIADEPTTALDASTQSRILDLLRKLQQEQNMSMIFISHDMAVISSMCSKLGVLYCGWLVEYGDAEEILREPMHPYTQALIASIPDLRSDAKVLKAIEGQVPSITERPEKGCVFYDRCPYRDETCRGRIPYITLPGGRRLRCIKFTRPTHFIDRNAKSGV